MVSRHTDVAITDDDRVQWSPEQQAEKQRELLRLAAAAPQTGTVRQHDESDLALFKSDEPPLL